MKPKGLLIAVVLLAVLGGLTWWSNKKEADKSKTPADTATKLLTIPDDQFQEIRITKLTGENIVLKRDNGKWRMTEPQPLPADQDAVNGIATALASLNADKVIEENATDLKPYGLDIPTLDVEVARKDGKTDHLLIGDDTPTGSGAYAKLAGDNKVVTVASSVKIHLDKRPDDLRDKRLLTFDSDKLSRVELTAKGPSHRVRQERPERVADRQAASAARRRLRRRRPRHQAEGRQDGPDRARTPPRNSPPPPRSLPSASPTPAAPRRWRSGATRTRTSTPRARWSKAPTRPTPTWPMPSTNRSTTSAIRSSSISVSATPAGRSQGRVLCQEWR